MHLRTTARRRTNPTCLPTAALTPLPAPAAGVELSAGLGALCFLFGTLLYDNGPLDGPKSVLGTVLWAWVLGSCLFTAGGCFLAARHFLMGVV